MCADYILALDQGTTSSRAMLFDVAGKVCGRAQRELTQHYPKPGWVEHDPLEILRDQVDVAVAALRDAGATAGQVAAVGIANQRESALLWNRSTGEPISNVIVWQDRRTAADCTRLQTDGLAEAVQQTTGLMIDPYFSGTKIRWLLEHVDGARDAAERGELAFGNIDSWLIWHLTGGRLHATDRTNASRTLLCEVATGTWSQTMLEALKIPPAILPEIVPSSGVIGECTLDELKGIPIGGIAGDQQAALFGQTCFFPGRYKNTYGTGCFLLAHCGTEILRSKHHLLTTLACSTGAELEYALEGSIFAGGAVIQWLRDGLGLIDSAPESERLAKSVADNGGVTIVPAFTGLGAPHWDPSARGTITGITRGVVAGHIARAALESIALQTADLLEAMTADAGQQIDALRVDGGASGNDLLMQTQADILGIPVIRPSITETTALGAAYLAGLATGFWTDRDSLAQLWKVERTFEPGRDLGYVAGLKEQWLRSVNRSRNWIRGA